MHALQIPQVWQGHDAKVRRFTMAVWLWVDWRLTTHTHAYYTHAQTHTHAHTHTHTQHAQALGLIDEVMTSDEYLAHRLKTHDVIKIAPAPDVRRWFMPPRPGGGGPPLPIGSWLPRRLASSLLRRRGVLGLGEGEEEGDSGGDAVSQAVSGAFSHLVSRWLGGVGGGGGGGYHPPVFC